MLPLSVSVIVCDEHSEEMLLAVIDTKADNLKSDMEIALHEYQITVEQAMIVIESVPMFSASTKTTTTETVTTPSTETVATASTETIKTVTTLTKTLTETSSVDKTQNIVNMVLLGFGICLFICSSVAMIIFLLNKRENEKAMTEQSRLQMEQRMEVEERKDIDERVDIEEKIGNGEWNGVFIPDLLKPILHKEGITSINALKRLFPSKDSLNELLNEFDPEHKKFIESVIAYDPQKGEEDEAEGADLYTAILY